MVNLSLALGLLESSYRGCLTDHLEGVSTKYPQPSFTPDPYGGICLDVAKLSCAEPPSAERLVMHLLRDNVLPHPLIMLELSDVVVCCDS